MRPHFFLTALLLLLAASATAADLAGVVVNPDREPLPGVTLSTDVAGVGAIGGADGRFVLHYESDVTRVTFSSVGYQSRQFPFDRVPDTVVLFPRYYRGTDIIVRGDRAQAGITPLAFTNYSAGDIDRDYSVGEFPLLLQTTPNLYVYTDGGAALGYSYVRIRGFDDQRIATYINGVPLNDPEDQATYFVDLPDFASNISDIQIQRGVGNSLSGGASFGGALNIATSNLGRERQVTFTTGYGEYTSDGKRVGDIHKSSLEYASGLIDGRWLFSGRYSNQKTGGYRRNSWYDGWSYYLSLARLDPNMTTELYLYGGPIRMHLAYWGIDGETMKTDRRANPLAYDNETDNFNQPHYHLHNTWSISDRATLANTLYYIRGEGYYEQLKQLSDESDFREYGLDTALVGVDEADLVRQQWVKKSQWGWNSRLDLAHTRGRHTFGGSAFYFESDHWGQVVWVEGVTDPSYVPRHRYYQYFGEKIESNAYVQEYFKLADLWSAEATAMIRYQRYDFDQTRMGAFRGYDYTVDWLFFSPRVGVTYAPAPGLAVFGNFAISSRTPTDATIYDANDPYVVPSLEILSVSPDSARWKFGDPTADAERVYDFELGGAYRAERWALDLTLYWMEFRDEILPYGAVDDDGLRRSVNAERSVHAGLELGARVDPVPMLSLSGNFSWSYNRLKDFVGQVELYDADWNYAGTLDVDFADNVVPGFPEYLGNLLVDYRRWGLRATWQQQLVGRQYVDPGNTGDLAIDPFAVSSVALAYTVKDLFNLGTVTFSLRVNNVFDNTYTSAGYGGNYAWDGGGSPVLYGWAEYFPAPERWFFGELKLDLY